MKSIFLTILIFIGVFAIVGSGALSVIGEDWFHYVSYALFACVILSGVYVTMFRKASPKTMEDEAEISATESEEENNEK